MPRAVILTAHFIDYQAVCCHLSNCKEETHPQGTVYELGNFSVGEQIWEIAIAEIDNKNTSLALETERAINHFQPDVIILVGTAIGIKDVQAGDIVVARKIYGYESGKAENEFLPRPEVQEPSYPLKERAKSEGRKSDWLNRLSNKTLNICPNILLAPIASGDKEVVDKQATLVEFLRTNYGDAVAVENLAFGFLRAAHANHNVLALTVHGISGLLDINAENIQIDYQNIAVQNATAFTFEVIAKYKIDHTIKITCHDFGQSMLSDQLRLTSNPLTSVEGISYRTEQVYVPLGLVERKKQARRREDVAPEEGSELYRETEIIQTFEHQQFLERVLQQRQSPKSQGRRIAIIGEPGAAKTTLLQQIARWVSEEIPDAVVIWVSLADLQRRELEAYLFEVWLQAVARKVGQAEASNQIKNDFVAQFNQGLVWLLLDGVDEMQATVGNPLAEINRQLRTGTLLQQARIVLSCRLNLWDCGSNALDSFDNYRTLDFSYPQQVEQFIGNWFTFLPSSEIQTGQRLCEALAEPGKERIRDLVKNPLRLTLLCFNWYLGEGKLPETKAGLYEQFVADFYEWKKGQFATTGEQRKRLNAALGELARAAIDKEEMRFRIRQEFVSEYLGEPDAADSLFGLALRLGWLNKVGVDGENPREAVYAFFHPTFQEYFAAKTIEDWDYFIPRTHESRPVAGKKYRIL